MSPADVNNVLLALTGVLVVLTAVVTWFAWQTVRESRKATTAIRETVAESTKATEAVQSLLTVAKDTASSSAKAVVAAEQTVAAAEESLKAARETIEVAEAARASDEHDRKVRQLRDIGQLAEALFWKAVRDSEVQPLQHGWRMIEHNYLEQALVGMAEELPRTLALTQANLPDTAIGAARDARLEIVQALEKLKTGAP
jgi:hypothetical protein